MSEENANVFDADDFELHAVFLGMTEKRRIDVQSFFDDDGPTLVEEAQWLHVKNESNGGP